MTPPPMGRGGFSMIELIMALAIFGFVAAGALSLVNQQEVAFSLGSARLDALQNDRFAAETVERSLRAAGNNTAPGQPFIVYADASTLTINADYAGSDENDPFAVYIDPGASVAETGALTAARRLTIPGTAIAYPDTTYFNGAVNSSAETITFHFSSDATTPRAGDYQLTRKVNDLPAEIVARGLMPVPGEPFFAYQEVLSGDTITARPQWIPAAALPLRHTVPMHLSVADTGSVARIDRIRAVRMTFTAMGGTGQLEQGSPVRQVIRIPNAGTAAIQSCGETPIFGSGVSVMQPTGEIEVAVSWNAATDESSGEEDVIRYAIFRRTPSVADWGEPYFSIPAGQASYAYTDTDVMADSTYQYAVAAQDCTPSISSLSTSSQILVAAP